LENQSDPNLCSRIFITVLFKPEIFLTGEPDAKISSWGTGQNTCQSYHQFSSRQKVNLSVAKVISEPIVEVKPEPVKVVKPELTLLEKIPQGMTNDECGPRSYFVNRNS
jgi:hypothetical protein